MPEDLSGLPNLLDDLPGKAVATYYGEVNDMAGAVTSRYSTSWARETVYFYGADGRWRVLHMEDLGLPDAGWTGSDNYGAGELSPNGRWWAAKSLRGSVIMDLKSGELHRGPAPQAGNQNRGTALLYRWTSDSKRVHITNIGTGPGEWASAPGFETLVKATGQPYPFAGGYIEPADPDKKRPPFEYEFFSNDASLEQAIIVGENILGAPFVYRDAGSRTVESGYLLGPSFTGERLGFLSLIGTTGRNYLTELTVVDAEDGSVDSRLQTEPNLLLGIEPFDQNLWLLAPGWSEDGYGHYPGMRYVWNADNGSVGKLTDLSLSGSEYRIYDFSYARDLIAR